MDGEAVKAKAGCNPYDMLSPEQIDEVFKSEVVLV